MSNYLISSDSDRSEWELICTSKLFKPLRAGGNDKRTYALFECSDEGVDFLKESLNLSGVQMYSLAGRDGNIYALNKDGLSRVFVNEKPFTFRRFKRSFDRSVRKFVRSYGKRERDKLQVSALINDVILRSRKALIFPSFLMLKFHHNSDGKCYRFRLHVPKGGDKKPVILFLHGTGAIGFDNIKQMWEVKNLYNRLKKANRDCYIIAPQLGSDEAYNTDEHSQMLWDLINALNRKSSNIDFSRIYLAGVSYGGYGVIYEAFRHPERYAAAVPTVGWVYLEGNEQIVSYKFGTDKYHLPFDDISLEEIAKTPLWFACSNIEAKYNEPLYEKLKAIGADVRLTRNDKHGHGMHAAFFKNEPWDEWMFEKSKQNSPEPNE